MTETHESQYVFSRMPVDMWASDSKWTWPCSQFSVHGTFGPPHQSLRQPCLFLSVARGIHTGGNEIGVSGRRS